MEIPINTPPKMTTQANEEISLVINHDTTSKSIAAKGLPAPLENTTERQVYCELPDIGYKLKTPAVSCTALFQCVFQKYQRRQIGKILPFGQ